MNKEIPLSAEELENVFDSLDLDSNGYLTLEEFSSGFSEFGLVHLESQKKVLILFQIQNLEREPVVSVSCLLFLSQVNFCRDAE